MALLDDFRDGRVEDRDGELLGTLLSELYPVQIGPEEIWDYLVPRGSSILGTHFVFWATRLLQQIRGSDVIGLIEALIAKGKEFRQDFSDYGLADMVLALLAEALAASDEEHASRHSLRLARVHGL